jgi:hypothetical protein
MLDLGQIRPMQELLTALLCVRFRRLLNFRESGTNWSLKVGLYAVVIGVNLLVYDVTAAARNTSSWYGQRGTQPRPWSTGKKVYIRHVLTHGEDDLGK